MAYVYRHIRLDTMQPFYVGKGEDNKNYSRSKSKFGRSKHWYNICEKHGYRIDIILDGLTRKEAIDKEIEFIKLYGRLDKGNGILINLTDGGDGVNGINTWNKGIKTGIGGFKGMRSEENKNKISESLKRLGIKPKPYIRTAEHKIQISQKMSKESIFCNNNPNGSHNYISKVLTKNGVIDIVDFKKYCQSNNINYRNLTYWSRNIKDKLHPKYDMRVLSIVKIKHLKTQNNETHTNTNYTISYTT